MLEQQSEKQLGLIQELRFQYALRRFRYYLKKDLKGVDEITDIKLSATIFVLLFINDFPAPASNPFVAKGESLYYITDKGRYILIVKQKGYEDVFVELVDILNNYFDPKPDELLFVETLISLSVVYSWCVQNNEQFNSTILREFIDANQGLKFTNGRLLGHLLINLPYQYSYLQQKILDQMVDEENIQISPEDFMASFPVLIDNPKIARLFWQKIKKNFSLNNGEMLCIMLMAVNFSEHIDSLDFEGKNIPISEHDESLEDKFDLIFAIFEQSILDIDISYVVSLLNLLQSYPAFLNRFCKILNNANILSEPEEEVDYLNFLGLYAEDAQIIDTMKKCLVRIENFEHIKTLLKSIKNDKYVCRVFANKFSEVISKRFKKGDKTVEQLLEEVTANV